jgi:hypothetical protein
MPKMHWTLSTNAMNKVLATSMIGRESNFLKDLLKER